MSTLSKKGKRYMVLACLLYAMTAATDVVAIYWTAKVLEYAEQGNITGLLWQSLARLGLLIFSYLLTSAAVISRLAFLSNGELCMKSGIMQNILRRPLKSFRGEEDAFYLNLLTTDVDMYVEGYLDNVPLAVNTVTAMLFSAFMLLRMHPLLLVSALAVSALPMLAIKPFASARQRTKAAYSRSAEDYTNALKENIEGYETIRSGNGEEYSKLRYSQASAVRQRAWAKDFFVGQMSFELLMHVAGVAGIVCTAVGGCLAVKGVMSIGMIFAALNYFSSISNGFSNATNYIVTIRSTKKVTKKLQDQRNMPCPEPSGLPMAPGPAVEYDNVTFAFGERKLYERFTHTFAFGGCYAIVGESGSGKSTLLKLLLKYFDGYEGTIRLAGQDIRQLSEKEVYAMVGVVNQSPYLFNASLYENITLFGGEPGRDSEEYHSLLKELNLTALAQRVGETPLGDFGDNISGGERQRINIARALHRHPRIVFFDEPTTGLDPENVALIDEFIFNCQDMTRVVITHNWSQEYLSRFDEVIQIGKG